MHAYLSQVKFTNDQMCGRCVERDKKKNVLSPTLDANQIWQKQVEVRDGEEAELEVRDGEKAAGGPAGGSKTLAAVEMGSATSWRPRDVELWPRGAERGRRCWERSGRRRRRGAGEKVGQPDDVGRRKRAPNTYEISAPKHPCLYTEDDL